MAKGRHSEKLLLKKIANSAQALFEEQRGLGIGQLISLVRTQLGISQRVLAKRADVPQSTISRIESGRLKPKVTTLEKILCSIECDLIITVLPRENLETIRENQAKTKARKKIQYLQGTMSLEKQEPNQELLNELYNKEIKDLLDSSGSTLWEE